MTPVNSVKDEPAIRFVGESQVPVWGLKGSVRQARAFRQAGHTDIAAWPENVKADRPLILIRADYAMDAAMVAGISGMPEGVLIDPDEGNPVAIRCPAPSAAEAIRMFSGNATTALPGLTRLRPDDLRGGHDRWLRKKGSGLLRRITPGSRRAVEQLLFGAAYKDVTDVVTKYVWPWPALHATRLCAVLGLSANAVTALSAVLVVAATLLFARGDFGLGLVAAWIMTFLDTVDGKLARVTITSSKFGNVFDHGIDLIHPPIWYWAWIAGLANIGMALPNAPLIEATVIGGYVLQRVQEGLFLAFFKMELHVWRRFDSKFRLITARRNPNLILLSAATLCGRPDIGIIAVATWTVLSIGVHALRMAQAAAIRARGGALTSWLAP